MGQWVDYRECCRTTAARDAAATFCPECGHPLFRCGAPGCGGLVTPLGHCPACVDLHLSLEKGAFLTARSGESLSVPFVLASGAGGRPLAIRSVLREGTNLARSAVPVPWEQLEPGRARPLAVEAGPFLQGGLHALRLTIVAAAAPGEIEETYAFAGEVAIDVEGPAPAAPAIDLGNARFGTGGMVYVNQERAAVARRRAADAVGARTEVRLERAERFELQEGCRGYQPLGARVPRTVAFAYAGFPGADRPPDGPLLQRPVIRCGRNGRAPAAGPAAADANDLCLRIYDPASGELDREASGGISRRAFDLALANDRLHVRAAGRQGLSLNGERVEAGDARAVGHGESVEVAAGRGRTLGLLFTFKVTAGLVTQIRIEKAS
ncbi:MAG: hypothetical protein H6Q10_2688 [Acidobacteria bacterium]|nr:hypothetical protein [Acidobacteriota bacterium]